MIEAGQLAKFAARHSDSGSALPSSVGTPAYAIRWEAGMVRADAECQARTAFKPPRANVTIRRCAISPSATHPPRPRWRRATARCRGARDSSYLPCLMFRQPYSLGGADACCPGARA